MTIMPLKQRTNNMFWINFKLSLKQNKKNADCNKYFTDAGTAYAVCTSDGCRNR